LKLLRYTSCDENSLDISRVAAVCDAAPERGFFGVARRRSVWNPTTRVDPIDYGIAAPISESTAHICLIVALLVEKKPLNPF
jgi:hypothetical protein